MAWEASLGTSGAEASFVRGDWGPDRFCLWLGTVAAPVGVSGCCYLLLFSVRRGLGQCPTLRASLSGTFRDGRMS